MRQAKYAFDSGLQSVLCCLFSFMHLRYFIIASLHSPELCAKSESSFGFESGSRWSVVSRSSKQ